MGRVRFLLVVCGIAASSPALSQTMTYEEATALLGSSCGADIDTNCRGVNLDPGRLSECLRRNNISTRCERDYPRAFSAIEQRVAARANLSKLCNWELNHLCGAVRQDPAKGLECLLESSKKATPNCNKAIDATGYR